MNVKGQIVCSVFFIAELPFFKAQQSMAISLQAQCLYLYRFMKIIKHFNASLSSQIIRFLLWSNIVRKLVKLYLGCHIHIIQYFLKFFVKRIFPLLIYVPHKIGQLALLFFKVFDLFLARVTVNVQSDGSGA